MATREELVRALAAADKAGNVDDAKFLADRINAMDAPTRGEENIAAQAKKEYNEMGTLDQITTALGDMAYSAANAPYLGHRDKIIAGAKSLFGDRSYDENLADQRKLSEAVAARAGSAGLGAEAIGGMVTGSAASRAGLNLLGDISSMPFWQRLLASSAAGGVEGAVYGGLSAAGEDQDVGSGIRTGGAIGTGMGGLGETIMSLLNRVTIPAAAAPSKQELADEVAKGYKDMELQGVEISPDAVGRLNDRMQRNVVNQPGGPRRISHNATFGELDAMLENTPSRQPAKETAKRVQSSSDGTTRTTTSVNGRPPRTREVDRVATGDTESTRRTVNMMPDRGLELGDVEEYRKAARRSTQNKPEERGFGQKIVKEIDDFTRSLTPDDVNVRSGANVADVVRDLTETRRAAHRSEKLGEISDIRRTAEIEAKKPGAQTSGDKIRGKVGDFLKDETNTNGYTPDEVKALEDILAGKGGAEAADKVSRALKGFGAFTLATGAGGAIGSMFGPAGIGAGGMAGIIGTKGLSIGAGNRASKITNKAIRDLEGDIARGYKSRSSTKMQPKSKDVEALRRALTILGLEYPGSE